MSGLLPMLILLPLLGGGLLLILSAKPDEDPLVNKSAVGLSGLLLIVSLLMIGGMIVRSNRAARASAG